MRLVYKHATHVIVWLGRKTPGVEEAFELAKRLVVAKETIQRSLVPQVGRVHGVGMDEAIEGVLATLPPSAMYNLSDLFGRQYFERI
jgi:hypothetical protein